MYIVKDGQMRMAPPRLKKLDFTPLGDRYLCHIIDPRELLRAENDHIMLPDSSEKAMGWKGGIIAARGGEPKALAKGQVQHMAHLLERDEWVPMFYEVGDCVMIYYAAGHPIRIGGETYAVVNQKDILGSFGGHAASADDP